MAHVNICRARSADAQLRSNPPTPKPFAFLEDLHGQCI